MERLKMMTQSLIGCVQAQMADIKNTNTKQLGQAIDMIKDLEQAMYYCTIIEAMNKGVEQPYGQPKYYTPSRKGLPHESYRDIDRGMGRMYYEQDNRQMDMRGSTYPMHVHDFREGRSAISRRHYMESKQLHQDKNIQMQQLEKYMQELSKDVTEMIEDASPEEKSMLHQKILTLAEKVNM